MAINRRRNRMRIRPSGHDIDSFHALAGRLLLIGLVLGLSACGYVSGIQWGHSKEPKSTILGGAATASDTPTVRQTSARSGNGVGVNSYLWRASLDTLGFMPLASADPFGGVIISDWYAPPATPAERFKVTVYILDKRLRADGLKVSVFRQQRANDGSWNDAALSPDTPTKLENAILARAREMRLASTDK
jgi:Domain of unknown function (DUF3576)